MPTRNFRRRRRSSYRAYLTSQTWRARRRRWYAAQLAGADSPPTCVVCGRVWTLRTGCLLHLTSVRLGREDDEDLVPLCDLHHRRLSRFLDRSSGWRRLDRASATAGLITFLRHTENPTSNWSRAEAS